MTKITWLLVIGCLGWLMIVPQLEAQVEAATLQIRYVQPAAKEVFLVWGVDGWQVVPEANRPPGTILRNGVMHTPMSQDNDLFVTAVTLTPGTILDYGFLTTRTTDDAIVSLWEAAGSDDFHYQVMAEGRVEHLARLIPGGDNLVAVSPIAPLAKVHIHTAQPQAGELTLVWGVNGWGILPEALRPTGTTVINGIMHTPMPPDGLSFTADLTVPAGATLDYGFLISHKRTGEAIIVWQVDGQNDFKAVINESVVLTHDISADLTGYTEVAAPLTPGWWLVGLLGAVAIVGTAVWQRCPNRQYRDWKWTAVYLIAAGLMLGLFLTVIRADLLGIRWIAWPISWVAVPAALAAAAYDWGYVTAVTLFFLLILWPIRARRWARRLLVAAFLVVVIFSLAFGLANVQVFYLLGQPATYQLFYYADFLNSVDSQAAATSNVSLVIAVVFVAAVAALLALAAWLARGMGEMARWSQSSRRVHWIWPVLVLLLGAYLLLTQQLLAQQPWETARLVNPIVTFAESLMEADRRPVLSTMAVPPEFAAEFASDEMVPGSVSYESDVPVQNVIIFVLESVPTKYVQAYGGQYPVTPELEALRPYAIRFDNIYAHAPASNKSLLAILGGIYPWISYRTVTQEQPEVAMETLSSVLHEQGYRTGFFSAADWRFQRGDEFLAQRQFDQIQDLNTLSCAGQRFESGVADEPFLDGVDDGCMVDALAEWLEVDDERPFFAMLWTVQTHSPYFVSGDELDYGVSDPALNRYLNALHYADAQIGRLVGILREQGQFDETLIVVVGDHGEAFGEHNQTGHALGIYEENVHVPLLLINPGLFAGETAVPEGGHVDIAPTVLHLLGLPAPASWEGRSLFAANRPGRTYFYTPWADTLFGLRQGDYKFIFNATTNQSELYNVRKDPLEIENISPDMPQFVETSQQHLAAWVQEHGRYMETLLAAKE